MQIDLLDRIVRLMWMLAFTIWASSAWWSNEPAGAKGDRRSDVAVWIVGLAWVMLLLRELSGPQIVPRVWWIRIGGAVITLTGLSFALASRYYLGRNWDALITLKVNHTLVQNGPYSIVQHPIYAGFMLALIGSIFTFGHLRSAIAAALIIAAWTYKSGLEESFLAKHFGTEYERYHHRVKRLIPYVW